MKSTTSACSVFISVQFSLVQFRILYCVFREISFVEPQHNSKTAHMIKITTKRSTLLNKNTVTARVWCRGRIDRKRNSTINLTTDSGACY